jgi:hypothetical protein
MMTCTCVAQAKEERIYEMQATLAQLLSEKEGWDGPLQTQLQQQQEKCDRLMAALSQVSSTGGAIHGAKSYA